MTGLLATSGDIEARDIIATNESHVGYTNILNDITDLQNNIVDTSSFVQNSDDALAWVF